MYLPAIYVCVAGGHRFFYVVPGVSLPLMLVFTAICALLGYRAISGVPPLLHTPLMSGMNALSGITLLAALALLRSPQDTAALVLTMLASVLAAVNVTGGFWVTERMLRLFRQEKKNDEGDGGHA